MTSISGCDSAAVRLQVVVVVVVAGPQLFQRWGCWTPSAVWMERRRARKAGRGGVELSKMDYLTRLGWRGKKSGGGRRKEEGGGC